MEYWIVEEAATEKVLGQGHTQLELANAPVAAVPEAPDNTAIAEEVQAEAEHCTTGDHESTTQHFNNGRATPSYLGIVQSPIKAILSYWEKKLCVTIVFQVPRKPLQATRGLI